MDWWWSTVHLEAYDLIRVFDDHSKKQQLVTVPTFTVIHIHI